jgi:ABC-2 type transport system ATP-binding protein
VVVLLDGNVRFDGSPAKLASEAAGRVWLADSRDPRATLAWIGGDGAWRNIGDPPANTAPVAPTIEDGYLVLAGAVRPTETAA